MMFIQHDVIVLCFVCLRQALNIPDYPIIVKKPMDLGTMNNKMQNREYHNAAEFAADMRLIFSNCYRFNPVGTDVHEAGRQLQQEFERRFAMLPDEEEVRVCVFTVRLHVVCLGRFD